MQKYKYKAVTKNKIKYKGTFLAENVNDLRRQLAKQKLYLVSAVVASDKSPNPFFSLTGKVSMPELTSFCRQFAIMINSGISIVDSLGILRNQSYTGYFKKILEMVHDDVNAGRLLSDAMKKHKRVFPNFFISMVYVGEMSGSLDLVLGNLADYYETDAEIKRKTSSAMTYPIILMVMLVAVVGLMMVFVVPTFRDSMNDLDVEMPALTTFIFNLSTSIVKNWKNIFLVIFSIVVLFMMIIRTKNGRYVFDKFKVTCPGIRRVVIDTYTARFAHGFGILLNSGMDLIDALEVISIVLGNKYVEERFEKAINDVRKGNNISMAFTKYNLFPDILVQMLSVGEKTGSLNEVLLKCTKYFDDQVETSLLKFTQILQPVMLAFMGLTIGVIFIAIYSPMLAIMEGIDKNP